MNTHDTPEIATLSAIELTPARRSELRAAAHGLNPVVSISQKGLSPTVLDEIERCLKAHELIKIRVFEADREARDALLLEICTTLGAAPVQHIGKLLIIWREKPVTEAEASPSTSIRPRRNPPRLTKKAAAAKTDKAARARPLEKGKPRRPTRTR
jgi:putative YhbY family RNA-binding protein